MMSFNDRGETMGKVSSAMVDSAGASLGNQMFTQQPVSDEIQGKEASSLMDTHNQRENEDEVEFNEDDAGALNMRE